MKFYINIDYSRDTFLTPFARSLLRKYYIKDRKLTYQEFFGEVACAYSDNQEHAQYMYDIISKLYFCPATPTLANAFYCGTDNSENLPISCYLNSVENSKKSIACAFNETMAVALADGGLGTNWSHVGAVGEYIDGQQSAGCITMIRAQSHLLRAFGGRTREYGSGAAYLSICHPEVRAFIEMRKPAVGADQEMKVPRYMHHGLLITDKFLKAVEEGASWSLKSATTGLEVASVDARTLWKSILATRVETGEPFLIFIDNVNRQRPEILKKLKINIEMSNLCTEIVLPTHKDHLGNHRTAICCLGSVNLYYYDIWKEDSKFFDNIAAFLDNVRLDFIKRAPSSLSQAVYATKRDGAIGLGVSGYSSYLQSKMIPLESKEASIHNKEIFAHIREKMDKASYKLACERGPCEDAQEAGFMERFTHKIALKPDALVAFFFNVSPNTEATLVAYMYKTLHGSHLIKNKVFENLLIEKNQNTEGVWSSILSTGTVKHLDFLTEEEKEVFKSPYEINPLVVVEQAGERQPYICQAASLNIRTYLPIAAKLLNDVHMLAAKLGVKSMYYLEAKSKFTIENTFTSQNTNIIKEKKPEEKTAASPKVLGDVCVGCE
jgi:ribonucleoside-diphosphate reductase alpha chain